MIMNIKNKRRFVIQEHHASHLHYDFRLEMPVRPTDKAENEGTDRFVLKSWAVPKNVSSENGVKRLAFQVEDHDIAYIDFEGIIKEGSYGAGEVKIWDSGEYEILSMESDERGNLKEVVFNLYGKKIRGEYALIKTRGFGSGKNRENSWLIFKKK